MAEGIPTPQIQTEGREIDRTTISESTTTVIQTAIALSGNEEDFHAERGEFDVETQGRGREGRKNWFARQLAFMDGIWMTMESIKTACFFTMLFSSLIIIASNELAKQMPSWGLTFVLFYTVWGIAAPTAVYLDLCQSSSRLTNEVSHAFCVGSSLYLSCVVLRISETAMIIPISVNLGLLGSVILQRMSPEGRNYVIRCLKGLGFLASQPSQITDAIQLSSTG